MSCNIPTERKTHMEQNLVNASYSLVLGCYWRLLVSPQDPLKPHSFAVQCPSFLQGFSDWPVGAASALCEGTHEEFPHQMCTSRELYEKTNSSVKWCKRNMRTTIIHTDCINYGYSKWHHMCQEIHFPRPIIFGIYVKTHHFWYPFVKFRREKVLQGLLYLHVTSINES